MIPILGAIAVWLLGWWLNSRLASGPYSDTRMVGFLAPLIFGLTVIGIWELVVRGLASCDSFAGLRGLNQENLVRRQT